MYCMMMFKANSFSACSHALIQLRGLSTAYVYQGWKLMIRDLPSFEMISHPFVGADQYDIVCCGREASSRRVHTLFRVHDFDSFSRSC